MSSYSLDSLEKYSNNDPKTVAREKIGLACTNLKNQDKHKDRTGFVTANNSDEVDEAGRKPSTTGRTSKLDENIGKFRRNAIITSGRIAKGEFCWSVEKLPVTVSTKTNFRTGRPVEKKFNVPRGRSSSLSLSKFRHDGSSLSGKGPEDVAEFMKADKKLGNVQPSGITDRSKKPVSYLEFYHRRFATSSEARDCTRVPVGSTPANGEIRTTNKRPTSTNDGDATLLLPRVEDFHRPELQHIVSEESSGSRSCDTFVAKGTEFERNGNDSKPGWPGCCSDGGQPINRQRRVSYKPYGIEDYKNLSVPSPDRSLGPDRHAMEKKGEWLMRRRTYGDSVSALNRQRILRRAEKLKLGCRRRNLSLISLIVLALSNMLLTFLLLQSENCTPENLPKEIEAVVVTEWSLDSVDRANRFRGSDDVQEQLQKPCPTTESYLSTKDDDTMRFDIRLGRWDSKRLFRTFDSVIVGTNYPQISRRSKSCLATQSSLEKLHSLVQVAHHWTGPISVALYAAGEEEFDALQYYLVYLRRCYTPIRERVNFSLAVPKNRAPERQPRAMELLENFDCAKPEATLTEIVARISSEQMSWRARNVYPQNHMRNLARKNCQTEWIFLTDVDIVPCINMTTRLDEFLTTGPNNCDKCAYVVPTYELDIRVRFPPNKTELVRLAKKGLARPFHQKVFIHNQFATNFTKWVMDVNTGAKGHENVQTGKIYVSHDVTNFEFFYEPFYVAKDVAPAHDERFIGYGYTRNTQVYEMFVAGYQFKVLSPVFTGHWGLQTRKGRPAWRERQNSVNRKHFESFRREIFARYQKELPKFKKGTN